MQFRRNSQGKSGPRLLLWNNCLFFGFSLLEDSSQFRVLFFHLQVADLFSTPRELPLFPSIFKGHTRDFTVKILSPVDRKYYIYFNERQAKNKKKNEIEKMKNFSYKFCHNLAQPFLFANYYAYCYHWHHKY